MKYRDILSKEESKRLNFLLINPGQVLAYSPGIPGGMAMLAALLENNNVFVKCIDCQVEPLSDTRLRDIILENNINVVGITGTTRQVNYGYHLIKTIKSISKDIVVMMGGPHAMVLPEEALDNGADLVVSGEGEDTFCEILPLIGPFSAGEDVLKDVKGASYRLGGESVHNAPRPRIEDLDRLPFQARHLFRFPSEYKNSFRITTGFTAQILGSRGCPYHCVFCSRGSYSDLVVSRSPENILEEIIFLKDRFGVKQIDFVDEFFFYNREIIYRFCNMLLEKNIKIHWSAGNTRVDSVDRDIFKLMRKSGCFRISFGIESGNQKILNKIGKKIKLSQAVEAVNVANDAGLLTGAFYIIGHHNETVDDIEDTIRFAKNLPASVSQFSINTPFPGTASYRILKKKKQILTDDWDQYTGFGNPVFFTENLSPEKIMEMYKKAYRECNYNAKFILNHLRNIIKTRGRYLYLYYTGFFQMLYRTTLGRSMRNKEL